MIKRILSGYGKLCVSAGKILALAALCAAFGCIVVLPLWMFAVSAPNVYSATVLIILTGSVIFFIARKIRTYLTIGVTDRAEKSKRLHRLAILLLRIAVGASGVIGSIVCVLHEMKGAAALTLFAAVVIYGILAFGLRKDAHKR
ncbi:hypothetical protein [Treponema brennaborense]|uniref:Lipoprotein n=1 Tax=Treponema brennaborense (strain DSM 12168 / CIP 105900 / DD5/3) TaxID=906968 RepID=F4LQG2_TREBD|nr:hypothetical protein [Treponema brennaborense]AEE17171.1 hypothetical protein Trebr_1749 [Treponema brennaborense DSM 12168]